MYTTQVIKARVAQQPFVPLRILTSSGRSYDVYHPDLVWVGAWEIHVGFSSAMDPAVYDGTTRIALMHITALEDLPAQISKTKKNGKPKK